jgi:exonuclease III
VVAGVIIVLNVHAPTEDKTDDVKDSFYEELERVFDKFPKYHMQILLGDFNVKVGKEDIFKQTIVIETLPHLRTSESKVRCSHNVTSINILGRLQMGKPTIRLTIFW